MGSDETTTGTVVLDRVGQGTVALDRREWGPAPASPVVSGTLLPRESRTLPQPRHAPQLGGPVPAAPSRGRARRELRPVRRRRGETFGAAVGLAVGLAVGIAGFVVVRVALTDAASLPGRAPTVVTSVAPGGCQAPAVLDLARHQCVVTVRDAPSGAGPTAAAKGRASRSAGQQVAGTQSHGGQATATAEVPSSRPTSQSRQTSQDQQTAQSPQGPQAQPERPRIATTAPSAVHEPEGD